MVREVCNYLNADLLRFLLSGDVAIQYQTRKAFSKVSKIDLRKLQKRIATEGWGAQFLAARGTNGHWGMRFYQPKWTSTHYTLLDLKNIGLAQSNQAVKETIAMILDQSKGIDGGINPSGSVNNSDVCINGMFLNYACYFGADQEKLKTVIDYMIAQLMPDGGFNCRKNRSGAVHSSLHSTISVLEGFLEYRRNDYGYRLAEIQELEKSSIEFLLRHRLYQSDHTGKTIDRRMVMLSYPGRWRYDILRCLDYLQDADVPYDERMSDAIEILIKKRRKNGRWPVQQKHVGAVHFDMEKTGSDSRWNTLRALRVLQKYGQEI